MPISPIIKAPYCEQGAASETSVNEAINRQENIGALYILDRDLSTPPGSESNGDAYLVKAPGSGGWAGEDNNIAAYYNGYVFIPPHGGMVAFVADEKIWIGYSPLEAAWHPLQRTWSETEEWTGEYWRGFKKYEKTFHLGALPNNGTSNDAHGIESGFKVVRALGTADNGTNQIVLPHYDSANGVKVNINETNIQLITTNDMSGYTGSITLEYIKGMTIQSVSASWVVPEVDLTAS